MSEIKYIKGNIFDSSMMTIVNTVNCVGFMGAGIALEYMRRYPEMFNEYKEKCLQGSLKIGEIHLWKKDTPWILNFPTKIHYQDDSKIDYLKKGLEKFLTVYKEEGITSIAFPQLGSSLGGLSWDDSVQPLISEYLSGLDIEIEIYEYDKYAEDNLFINLRNIIKHFSLKDYKKELNIGPTAAERIVEALDSGIQSLADFEYIKGVGKESLNNIYALAKKDSQAFETSEESEQRQLFEDGN